MLSARVPSADILLRLRDHGAGNNGCAGASRLADADHAASRVLIITRCGQHPGDHPHTITNGQPRTLALCGCISACREASTAADVLADYEARIAAQRLPAS